MHIPTTLRKYHRFQCFTSLFIPLFYLMKQWRRRAECKWEVHISELGAEQRFFSAYACVHALLFCSTTHQRIYYAQFNKDIRWAVEERWCGVMTRKAKHHFLIQWLKIGPESRLCNPVSLLWPHLIIEKTQFLLFTMNGTVQCAHQKIHCRFGWANSIHLVYSSASGGQTNNPLF